MSKLRLSLESLEVTSFATVAAEGRERGTVQGNYLDTREVCDSTRAPRNCACSVYCPTFAVSACPEACTDDTL